MAAPRLFSGTSGKMALAWGMALLRAAGGGWRGPGRPLWAPVSHGLCSAQAAPEEPPEEPKEPPSPYRERPWEYLESDEYRATYGDQPVWRGYRRNHKGAIPPQRTRKACVRRGKRVGNPCPVCRDPHLHLHFRNVKLLDQFICPNSGTILHPTHTGVCMKQQKLLTQVVTQARDHGLLWQRVPYVPAPRAGDFSNGHGAVAKTPPAPAGTYWYPWYERWAPPAADVARVRRLYRGYLKEDVAPAATPEAPAPPPAGK